jgi:hypothetical protein
MAKPQKRNSKASEITVHTKPRETCLETLIRAHAYELYEQPGKEDGHAEEDWLSAEAEVLTKALSAKGS